MMGGFGEALSDKRLDGWNENPAASKREIGAWAHSQEDVGENNRPISDL
jgi:hypothetical protein